MTLLLIILAALAAYTLFLLASPATACRACRGWGAKGERWRRRAACRHCGGTGIRFRPGAPLVHRATAAVRRARANGDLTTPPWRPARTHRAARTPDNPEGENRP
ncbi:MAG: hypothetical protein ACR2MP_19935 [Streptosporangiaceae bacterium]